MQVSLVFNVFERNFVPTLGGNIHQERGSAPEQVSLQTQTEIRGIGFQPNNDGEVDE